MIARCFPVRRWQSACAVAGAVWLLSSAGAAAQTPDERYFATGDAILTLNLTFRQFRLQQFAASTSGTDFDTGFLSPSQWTRVGTNPERLVFTGSGAGRSFRGNALLDGVSRAVLDVTTGSLTIRLLMLPGLVRLDIRKPPLIDPAEPLIPEPDKLPKGAQTFVNLDNDDSDGSFDISENNVTGGDDELIRITLRVLPIVLQRGNAKLEATEGAGHVRVWKAKTKGTEYTLGTNLAIPGDFMKDPDGLSLFLDLWVEGISPHTDHQQGTKLKLSFSDFPSFKSEVAVTVLGIHQVSWIGRGNSVNNDDTLDEDPNFPAGIQPRGLRVFPDARVVGDAIENGPRDTVEVQVLLTLPPIETVSIYLESFDVDDPAATRNTADLETGAEDNFQADSVFSRKGIFAGQPANSNSIRVEFEPASAARRVEFRFPIQPANNFRVAAYADRDFSRQLVNDDFDTIAGSQEDRLRIYSVRVAGTFAQKEIRNSESYSTPVLTVWRFLHIERDSMRAPGAAEVFGGATDDVDPGNIGEPNITLLANFRPVYVEAVDDLEDLDANDDCAFVRNVADADVGGICNDVRDVRSRNHFWVVQVVGAYEGRADEDFDPNQLPVTLGITQSPGDRGALIFTEAIRDRSAFPGPNPPASVGQAVLTQRVVLHEVLHHFNIGHGNADSGPINVNNNLDPGAGGPAANQLTPFHYNRVKQVSRPD